MSFLLKIVEGPNKGAEIALVEGVAVSLGKSDDCDIVLADPTLPASPVEVAASADGVSVNGERLEAFAVKTVGATSFAVGPADAPWGELVWPKAEGEESPRKEADVPGESPKVPENAEKDERKSGEAEESHRDSESRPEGKKRHGGCCGCLVGLLVLLLILVGLAWHFRTEVRPHVETIWNGLRDRFRQDPQPSILPATTLSDIAAKYGLLLVESNGMARISGNLKTRRERLVATAEAYQAAPGLELDLSDDESFRTAAEDALFTLSEGTLKVAAATNRVLKVVGASSSPLKLKKTLEALNADLPKLCDVDVSGVSFSAALANNDLADSEQTVSQDGVVRKRKKSKDQTDRQYSLPVCGILTTPYSCLVMRDGRRLMEGAAIGDSVIIEIGADSVTLTNSTGRFTWKP